MVQIVEQAQRAVPYLRELPFRKFWVSYDQGADVMYISFDSPQKASDSELLENDVIVRRRGNRVIGLTILRASRFKAR